MKYCSYASEENKRVYFREGDIWWVRLGVNVGFEIDGKHQQFARPVIVLKKCNQYSLRAAATWEESGLPAAVLFVLPQPVQGCWLEPTVAQA